MTNVDTIYDRYGRQIYPHLNGAQTETGEVAQSVARVAGQVGTVAAMAGKVAAISAAIPGVGTVVAVVAGVVAAAAILIDSIFGSDEDKAKMEQAGQINAVNAVIRQQIQQVDQKTVSVRDGLQVMDQTLKSVGLAGIGNGSLGNYADATVLAASQSNTQLKASLAAKTENLKALILLFNDTVERTYNLVTGKSSRSKIILWSLAGVALAGIGYIVYLEFKKKKGK